MRSVVSLEENRRKKIVTGSAMKATLGFESGKGDSRVIITAPHGGHYWLPGVEKRSSPGACTMKDSYTVEGEKITHSKSYI